MTDIFDCLFLYAVLISLIGCVIAWKIFTTKPRKLIMFLVIGWVILVFSRMHTFLTGISIPILSSDMAGSFGVIIITCQVIGMYGIYRSMKK
jgi:hypothetical protein